MSDDFDKSDGEINPLLNALKGAQNTRQSIEEKLKKELQKELEDKVSAYIDTLGLGEKIAAVAIKGGSKITVDLDAHKINRNVEKICISNSDESTGFKFAKLWDEFYELLAESLSVPDEITCTLVRENFDTRCDDPRNTNHPFSGSDQRSCKQYGVQYNTSRKVHCERPLQDPVHHLGYPNYTMLTIFWTN